MSDVETIVKLPEEVKVMITRVGLLRIPDEMKEIVDRAIQGGRVLPSGYGTMYGTMGLLRAADEMRKTVDKGIQGEKALSNNKTMGAEEVLGIIHKEGIEAEVFKALSAWLVDDRETQIRESDQQKAIIRAVGKIANNNPSKTEALDGVKALCESELEENEEDMER